MLSLCALLLAAGPVIPDAPDEGVDADVRATLDEARAKLDAKDPSADESVLDLHLATDRFSRAQAGRVTQESIALLREAGAVHLHRGEVELGARDLDAAWQLAGKGMDLQLAAALASWAARLEATDKPAALYLARRALLADPANTVALRIDDSLTHNPMRVVGYSLMGVAAVAFVSGVVLTFVSKNTTAQIQSHEIRQRADWDVLLGANAAQLWLSVASYVGASVFYLGGVTLLGAGRRSYVPTSPALLPALPEVRP